MRIGAVLGALLSIIPMTAYAEDAPSAAPPAAAPQQDPADEVVCRRIVVTGTRVGGKKICMTRREWEQQKQNAKDLLNDVTNKSLTASPPGG